MALSRYEQRALDEIAIDLYAQDRRLASRLADDGWLARSRLQRLAASALFVFGFMLLAGGILVPHSFITGILAVSILGYIVMFAAALLWCRDTKNRFR